MLRIFRHVWRNWMDFPYWFGWCWLDWRFRTGEIHPAVSWGGASKLPHRMGDSHARLRLFSSQRPLVAALMVKGMSAGAGLVFLLAGPATNYETIIAVARYISKRGCSRLHFLTFRRSNLICMVTRLTLGEIGATIPYVGEMIMLPAWISVSSALILLFLLTYGTVMKLADLRK